jgi:hypothetical protein
MMSKAAGKRENDAPGELKAALTSFVPAISGYVLTVCLPGGAPHREITPGCP